MLTNQTLPTANDILAVWTKQQKIEYFESLLASTGRSGVDKIIEFARNSDFYSAPSSTKYHSNYDGGLLDHVLLVYLTLVRYTNVMTEMQGRHFVMPDANSLIISALLHDICKTGFYKKVQKYRKNTAGMWETYYGYEIEDLFPLGHGEKSVIMLQQIGLDLTVDEMIAIRYHMGSWDGGMLAGDVRLSYQDALNRCPLMILLQAADSNSTLLLEENVTPEAVSA